MTGLEEKVAAGVALKATDSVVKTFFAPQVASLKEKLRERFVESQISDTNVDKIFNNYFATLLNQCNTIDSIIFPQKSILLESIYEPLDLIERNAYAHDNKGNDKFFNTFTDKLIHDKVNKNIILIDTAGMGKSTFCKFLILKILKNKLHTKLPIFIELRKVNSGQTLINYITQEINLKYKNGLTEEMLIRLMEKGSFIFFFDGFDEVSQANAPILGEQISKISKSFNHNTIILTSRDQEYIPSLTNSLTGMFKPLVIEQIKSLVLKYDNFANIEVGKNLIAHENFANLDYDLFRTPLMVTLLYKSFGYNRTIDNNVVTFYDEMFNALYKGHDLTKEGFGREKLSKLNYENFKTLFNAFCFVSLYENKASFKNKTELIETLKKAKKLSSIDIENLEYFFKDLLQSVPLLTKDGTEYKFMHKTIMEFFAAEFLNYSEISHDLFQKIIENKLLSSFEKSFEFLYEINEALYIKEIGKILLNDIIDSYENKYKRYSNIYKSIFVLLGDNFSLEIINNKDKKINRSSITAIIQTGDTENYEIQLHYPTRDNSYQYTPLPFLKKIQDKDAIYYTDDRLNDYDKNKKSMKELLNIIKYNKIYSINSDEIYNLQNNSIIKDLLLIVTTSFSYSKLDKNIAPFNISECRKLLSMNQSKLNVLD